MRKTLTLTGLFLPALFLLGCAENEISNCGLAAPEEINKCCAEENKDKEQVQCVGEWNWDTQKNGCVFTCKSSPTDMPNPASKYCENQGHNLVIVTDREGNQYGICKFADGTECEEWEYFTGSCKQGDREIAVALDEEQCKNLKGKWGSFTRAGTQICNLPTKDGGSSCTDGEQCETNLCIAEPENPTQGRCPSWKINTGCLNVVEKGVAKTLCSD